MRKYLFSAILLLLTSAAFAQDNHSNLGFHISFTEPILRERQQRSINRYDTLATTLNGFKVGLVYETTFVKGFGLSTGINYTFAATSGKWNKATASQIGNFPKTKSSVIYNQIEIPIDWQYKFTIAYDTYIILYTGPTIQCAFNWSETTFKQTYKDAPIEKNTTNLFTDCDLDHDQINDYTRFNITWGLGAGFQYKRYFIRGGYDFGIFSPYNDRYFTSDAENSWKRHGRLDQWQIKIGMYLWDF